MSENRRRLLPYEYQLIDSLGITKEEYLDFVAYQEQYKDIKEGTALDVRNDFGIIAIVLTVVGLIFQVVGALLARPEDQKGGDVRRARSDVFAPRYGFNAAQELAKFGDPVNLVYTNSGARVSVSLVWSAIRGYGSTQLAQLLFVIGAGPIGKINVDRSAFGQTPLKDIITENYWMYFKEDGTGALAAKHLLDQSGAKGTRSTDPSKLGTGNMYRVVELRGNDKKVDGFAHAYSPSTSNSLGIYGIVPINIDLHSRQEDGDPRYADNEITITSFKSANGTEKSPGSLKTVNIGDTMVVRMTKYDKNAQGAEVDPEEMRLALQYAFDESGLYKYGSATFKATRISGDNIVDGEKKITFKCIEAGNMPAADYEDKEPKDVKKLRGLDKSTVKIASDVLKADQSKYARITGENDVLLSPKQIYSGTTVFVINGRYEFGTVYSATAAQILKQGNILTYNSITDETYIKTPLTKRQKEALSKYANAESIEQGDDSFFTKAIAKIEKSSYETISPCSVVDFVIKGRVSKRLSGRTAEYGSEERNHWAGGSAKDNGVKARSAMFIMKYRKSGAAKYITVPGIFVISSASEAERYFQIRFDGRTAREDKTLSSWEFEFEPVIDPLSEWSGGNAKRDNDGKKYYYYLSSTDEMRGVQIGKGRILFFYGKIRESINGFPPVNLNPLGMNEWDTFSFSTDDQVQFSFDQGPELSLSCITEQIISDFSDNYPNLYDNLSMLGINIYAGKSVQSLRSISVYVEKGRKTLKVVPYGASGIDESEVLSEDRIYANTAPDIFVDTVLDTDDGIGQFATVHSLDLIQLSKSKQFCVENDFRMDGVIADVSSWREFWARTAGFSLLELVKTNGQDSLAPALPYVEKGNNAGKITRNITISALFNQGNILEDSFKEEFLDYGSNTQDTIVTMVYREDDGSSFEKNKSVEVRLSDTNDKIAVRETVDLSDFVKSRKQAIAVGKFLCNSRRYSQRAIEFKTFPTDTLIKPGAYIYVETGYRQWDNIYTGTIEEGGRLNFPIGASIKDGSYSTLIYSIGGNGVTAKDSVSVVSGIAASLASSAGSLVVMGTAAMSKRVFRVTEVEMDEEGEVIVKAVEHRTETVSGAEQSLISKGIASKVDGLFLIDGKAE